MHVKNRIFNLSYKLVLIVFGITGVALSLGIHQGQFNLRALTYFTVLSNLLCVVYFILGLIYLIRNIDDRKKTTWFPGLKGIAMMCITVTLLVAHFLLGARFTMGNASGISLLIAHYIVPLMVILDWLLFDKKGLIRATSPLIWTIAPLLYFAYTVLDAHTGQGHRYPYPFLDASTLGWSRVSLTVLALVIFFVVLGYVYFAIDRVAMKLGDKKE